MKHLSLLLVLVSLSVTNAQERRIRVLSSAERPLEERLNGRTEWAMSNGDTLKIASADGAARLSGPTGIIVDVPAPEHVDQVALSQSGSCLLLRIMAARPSGGSDYSRLIRVSRDAHGRWVAHTLFAKDTPPMNELHRWVSDIGAISDSGRMALFKLGEANQEVAPYRMEYSWQTWLLDSRKKVSDGIRVPDDFDK